MALHIRGTDQMLKNRFCQRPAMGTGGCVKLYEIPIEANENRGGTLRQTAESLRRNWKAGSASS